MSESLDQPIGREVFDTQQLVTAFPPKLRDRSSASSTTVRRIAFDLDETLGVPLIEGSSIGKE